MKPKQPSHRFISKFIFACGAAASVASSSAATWTGPLGAGSHVWNTSGTNWDTNPSYPTGTDSTAIFNSNFTGTLTMTGDNTLGSISYTDTGSSNNGLQLASGTLTFDTSSGTPAISYLNGTGNGLLWIGQAASFAIAGNDGLTIDAGNSGQSVRLGNATGSVGINWSSFTGALTLARGSFQPQVANVLPQAAGSKVVLGSGSSVATLSLFSNTRNQSIVGLDGNSVSSINNGSNGTTATLTLGANSIFTESFDFQGQIGSVAASNDNIAVTKTGAGTQTLSGNNLYTGTTTVSGGALKLGSSTALGSTTGVTTVGGSAALDLNGQTVAENFGDTSSIDGFTGQGLGNNGALINSSGTTATISGNIYTNAAGALTGLGVANTNGFVIGSGNITLNGEVGRRNSGITSMAILKTGTGTLTIGGAVTNGTLGDLYINSGTATLAKTGNAVAVSNVTINGGTLKMDFTKTTSPANVWQGQVGNGVTFGASGGTWDLNGTGGNNNRLKGVSGTTGSITNSGVGAALVKFAMRDNSAFWSFSGTISDGSGTVAVETANGGFGSGQVQVLGGNNSYTGGTSHNYGTLRMGHDNAFGTGTVASASTLDLNGFTLANTLTSPGNGAVFTNSSSTKATVATGFNTSHANGVVISDFTVGSDAGDIDWSGDAYRTNGVGTITKNGSNKVTFGGEINDMGINANAGTTELSGTLGGAGNAAVALGATMNVTSGGLMDGVNLTTVTGAFALLSGGAYKFDIGSNGVNDAIVGTGTVNLDGSFIFDLGLADLTHGNSWQIVDAANLNESYGTGFSVFGFSESANIWTKQDGNNIWAFSESTGQLNLAVIPEPEVSLIGGLGLLMLLRRRR